MISTLFRRLFASEDVRFDVSGDVDAAIDRISRLAKTPLLQATFSKAEPSLVGSVSRRRVRLRKATPLFGNFFKPIFIGAFQVQGRNVCLVGKFKMGPVARLFAWFSILMGIFTQLVAFPSFMASTGISALGHLEPMLFIAIGLLVLASAKLAGQRDIRWIKQQIARAL
jgi:hypothetical protein